MPTSQRLCVECGPSEPSEPHRGSCYTTRPHWTSTRGPTMAVSCPLLLTFDADIIHKKRFQNHFCSTRTVERWNGEAFTRFQTVRSILAPDHPLVCSIVSFLSYTDQCSSSLAIARLSFFAHAHILGQNRNDM